MYVKVFVNLLMLIFINGCTFPTLQFEMFTFSLPILEQKIVLWLDEPYGDYCYRVTSTSNYSNYIETVRVVPNLFIQTALEFNVILDKFADDPRNSNVSTHYGENRKVFVNGNELDKKSAPVLDPLSIRLLQPGTSGPLIVVSQYIDIREYNTGYYEILITTSRTNGEQLSFEFILEIGAISECE